MANTSIDQAAVEQFDSNIRHIYQQKEARLANANCAIMKSLRGVTQYFDKLAAATAQAEVNTQTDETPNLDPGHTKRQIQPLVADWGTMAPNTDVERMLLDPTSAYVTSATRAIRRQQDDYFITAFKAAALDIDISGDKATDLTTSVAFPAGNTIPVGGTALTLDKLLEAKEKLDANEVDDDGRCFVLGSQQLRNLLDITEVGSADYNTVKALVRGEVDTFLGFKFIRSERLPLATADRSCFAWHRDAMGMAVNNDLMVRVAERPDRRFNTHVYVRTQCNAVRVWEEGVIEVVCLES